MILHFLEWAVHYYQFTCSFYCPLVRFDFPLVILFYYLFLSLYTFFVDFRLLILVLFTTTFYSVGYSVIPRCSDTFILHCSTVEITFVIVRFRCLVPYIHVTYWPLSIIHACLFYGDSQIPFCWCLPFRWFVTDHSWLLLLQFTCHYRCSYYLPTTTPILPLIPTGCCSYCSVAVFKKKDFICSRYSTLPFSLLLPFYHRFLCGVHWHLPLQCLPRLHSDTYGTPLHTLFHLPTFFYHTCCDFHAVVHTTTCSGTGTDSLIRSVRRPLTTFPRSACIYRGVRYSTFDLRTSFLPFYSSLRLRFCWPVRCVLRYDGWWGCYYISPLQYSPSVTTFPIHCCFVLHSPVALPLRTFHVTVFYSRFVLLFPPPPFGVYADYRCSFIRYDSLGGGGILFRSHPAPTVVVVTTLIPVTLLRFYPHLCDLHIWVNTFYCH